MLSCAPDLFLLNQVNLQGFRRRHFLMKSVPVRSFLCLVMLVALPAVYLPAQPADSPRHTAGQASKIARPRLVLLIVVDQFRFDYLSRFGDLFGPRGIGRLMREGASWTHANYDHYPTYTAPGHATLMTGAWPARTGIVANDWYERAAKRKVSSVTDDSVHRLPGTPGLSSYSPRRLLCSTIGDELRQASGNRAKVIGISAKGRSAILPAGRGANAAYWYSTENGNMVSSTYYFSGLPDWVDRFNERRVADKWFGARWDRLLPDESEYLKRAGKDDVPWENLDKNSNDTNYFPHVLNRGAKPDRIFYRALDYTPYSNELLLAFTKEAIVNEKLGSDADTDVLSVSFSANDYVGHRFGPFSQEAMDMSLRVDQQIAALLDFIDAEVGLRNTLVAFTADHGAAPVPEDSVRTKRLGRRHTKDQLLNIIRTGLVARYAREGRQATDYISSFTNREGAEPGFINGNVYLNHEALKRDGIDIKECEQVVGEIVRKIPGITRYFTRTQLERKAVPPSDEIGRRVLHGFHSQRSGDVILIFAPYNSLFGVPDDPADTRSTATHGSPYEYDTHVPLIMMGTDFKAGRYPRAATPADIAPTLARLLNISLPNCSAGRVLKEGLRYQHEQR